MRTEIEGGVRLLKNKKTRDPIEIELIKPLDAREREQFFKNFSKKIYMTPANTNLHSSARKA